MPSLRHVRNAIDEIIEEMENENYGNVRQRLENLKVAMSSGMITEVRLIDSEMYDSYELFVRELENHSAKES